MKKYFLMLAATAVVFGTDAWASQVDLDLTIINDDLSTKFAEKLMANYPDNKSIQSSGKSFLDAAGVAKAMCAGEGKKQQACKDNLSDALRWRTQLTESLSSQKAEEDKAKAKERKETIKTKGPEGISPPSPPGTPTSLAGRLAKKIGTVGRKK